MALRSECYCGQCSSRSMEAVDALELSPREEIIYGKKLQAGVCIVQYWIKISSQFMVIRLNRLVELPLIKLIDET